MEEQVWELVEKALAGNASQQDLRMLRQVLARNKTLHAQVYDFLENYVDPDPQIQPQEKKTVVAVASTG